LQINNTSGMRVDLKNIRKAAALISARKGLVVLSFVKRPAMLKLNRKFRGKNKPTDVLSFNMDEGGVIGDVIICPSVARRNAAEFGVTFNEEIARLAVHGMLHLLGHEHGRKMFGLQDRMMRRIGYA